MKSEKFVDIPYYKGYSISKLGHIVDVISGKMINPYKKNKEYYVFINNTEIRVAELSLLTFIGKFPANIVYKFSKELYDILSVEYELNTSSIINNDVFINGVSFRRIPGYENYFISRDGICFNKKRNIFLIRTFSHNNYPSVSIPDFDDNGNKHSKRVHRLVYETYIGKLIDDLVIDHVNGYKWCCSDWNLEQVSVRENYLEHIKQVAILLITGQMIRLELYAKL